MVRSSLLGERIEDWQLYVILRWRGEGVVEEEGLGEVLEAKGRWSLKCGGGGRLYICIKVCLDLLLSHMQWCWVVKGYKYI